MYKHKETGKIINGKSLSTKGRLIFNPSQKMLEDAGYEVYVPEGPSEEELKRQELQNRMNQITRELSSLDYLTSKELDGEDMSEYNTKYGGDYHQYRINLRKEYNELEAQLVTNTEDAPVKE